MRNFILLNGMIIRCETITWSNCFEHKAVLYNNGKRLQTEKARYDNRTWERNKYDTVIERLINKTNVLTSSEKQEALKRLNP